MTRLLLKMSLIAVFLFFRNEKGMKSSIQSKFDAFMLNAFMTLLDITL